MANIPVFTIPQKAQQRNLAALNYHLPKEVPPKEERLRIGAQLDAAAQAAAKAEAEANAKAEAEAKARAEALAHAQLARQLGCEPDELAELERQWELLAG